MVKCVEYSNHNEGRENPEMGRKAIYHSVGENVSLLVYKENEMQQNLGDY